jgi:hypothetical protein
MRRVLLIIGGLFALVVLLFLGLAVYLGIMMETGRIPDAVVLRGAELKPAAQQAIESVVTLQPDERIKFYYSTAMLSYEADGNLITDQRVVSYQTYDGQLYLDEAAYDEIVAVEPFYSESFLDDTMLFVTHESGNEFVLVLSADEDRDRPAVDYVLERVAAHTDKEDDETAAETETSKDEP